MFPCYICKQKKSAEDFCKDKSRVTGLSSKCKHCMKERNRAKRHTDEGRAHQVIVSRRWKRANKMKEHAHKAVARALKSGRLLKPNACTKCGDTEKIEGHHPDYDFKLKVLWLCQKCHIGVHHATR